MKRQANADEVFGLFDRKIEDYLKRNRAAIEKEYKAAVGRPVEDSEIDAFISGLGDSLYAGVKLDPAHVTRFVDFYVNDDKLAKAVSDAVEEASFSPSRAASDLRFIADALDASRRPSMTKVAMALTAVLRRL